MPKEPKKVKKFPVKEQPLKLDMSFEEAIKLALKTPIKTVRSKGR